MSKKNRHPKVVLVHGSSRQSTNSPQDIIIFIVGGTTFEEAKLIASLNKQFAEGHGLSGTIGPSGPIGAGTRLLLGGTCVHNSKTCVSNPLSSISYSNTDVSDLYRFLQMTRDASFSFPAGSSSATLALRPTTTAPTAPAQNGPGLNLNLGPVSLNVGGGAGGALEAGVDAARDGLRTLFGKVREGVDGVVLR